MGSHAMKSESTFEMYNIILNGFCNSAKCGIFQSLNYRPVPKLS
jgi:hypothetical protein